MVVEIDSDRIAKSFYSKLWQWQIAAEEKVEANLEKELRKRLPHIDPISWKEREQIGGIYLAGRAACLSDTITPPCRLEYYEPRVSLEELPLEYPAFDEKMLLYADEDLGVIMKPAGLPTMPARDQQRYNLWRYLRDHYHRAVHLPSRLDTGVSGLVLCSFSDRMNRHLQKAYDRKLVEKHYMAEISGFPEWFTTRVERAIARDSRHPVLRRCVESIDEGEFAITNLRNLGGYDLQGGSCALLQAEPLTGRTHQIRLHCSSEGLPIIGDPYYGGAHSPELRLVSFAIRLFHPYQKKEMTWELPVVMWPQWLTDASARVPSFGVTYRKRIFNYESDSN